MFRPAPKKIRKEVNKLEFFETKIIKIKEKKGKVYSNQIIIDGKKYTLYEDKDENVYPHKEKGNWVNGENLDKIKFPCFCSYVINKTSHNIHGYKFLGMLNKGYDGADLYELHKIDSQTDGLSRVGCNRKLSDLINIYHINILKGKILIFEEIN